jgi:hypothetical protein
MQIKVSQCSKVKKWSKTHADEVKIDECSSGGYQMETLTAVQDDVYPSEYLERCNKRAMEYGDVHVHLRGETGQYEMNGRALIDMIVYDINAKRGVVSPLSDRTLPCLVVDLSRGYERGN